MSACLRNFVACCLLNALFSVIGKADLSDEILVINGEGLPDYSVQSYKLDGMVCTPTENFQVPVAPVALKKLYTKGGNATALVTKSNFGPLRIKNLENVLEVIGNDDRKKMVNAGAWPFNVNVKIKSVDSMGQVANGSGIVIGPRHILTAAHNVYDVLPKNWHSNITIYANASPGTMTPASPAKIYVSKEYTAKKNETWDMALIVLGDDIGKTTGWFGIGSFDMESLHIGTFVTVAGYPNDKIDGLWWHMESIKNIVNGMIQYDVDTNEGQSGSGVWLPHGSDGEYKVIGVHVNNLFGDNRAVYLNGAKFGTIFRWLNTKNK